jgi:UDP-2,3-diacylglucosamine hydrolase
LNALDADALFVLGDLFEAWVGDDALSQPFAQAVAAAFHRTSLLRPQFFQHGNRDFLLGSSMAHACGFQLLGDLLKLDAFGQRYLVAHGDAQCIDDEAYQAFRAQVRQPAWQEGFLAQPLDRRLAIAAQMRDASKASQSERREAGLPFADPDAALCSQLLREAGATTLIHGHTHRPGRYELGDGLAREVLCDWDCEHSPTRGELFVLSAQGIERLPLSI